MKELKELVEQAKFVADWHGGDWSSALCQDKDGKQAHEIICESRGESVISTGSNSNEASWLCDYLELCSPANILAIAEAFRALEQRAEAAEARSKVLADDLLIERTLHNETLRREELIKEKLEELEKREPIAWIFEDELPENYPYDEMYEYSKVDVVRMFPVFGPAPAINLAELVPDAIDPDYELIKRILPTANPDEYACCVGADMWNACIAAMLRNIEEKSK